MAERKVEVGFIVKVRELVSQFSSGLNQMQAEASKNAPVIKPEIDTRHADAQIVSLKDKIAGAIGKGAGALNNIGGTLGGALLGGAAFSGIAAGFSLVVNKAREVDDAEDGLSIALSRTNLSAAKQAEEFERIATESAPKLADSFAMPKAQVMNLMGTIAAFSGKSGADLDKLTEISIGASQAMGMSAEGVARLLAKGADPEMEASLGRLGIHFDKTATAADRMRIITEKFGPSIQATKDAANDSFGSMERVMNTVNEVIGELAMAVMEVLKPVFDIVLAVIKPIVPLLSMAGDVIKVLLFPLKVLGEILKFQIGIFNAVWNTIGKLIGKLKDWFVALPPVKAAIEFFGQAVEAVTGFINGFVEAIESIGGWFEDLLGLSDDVTESTLAVADAEKKAAEASANRAAQIQGVIEALEAQKKADDDYLKGAEANYVAWMKIADDPTRSKEDRDRARKQAADWVKASTDEAARLKKTEEYGKAFKVGAGIEEPQKVAAKKEAKDFSKQIADEQVAAMLEGIDKERAVLKNKHEQELKAAEGSEKLLTLIRARHQKERLALEAKHIADLRAEREKALQAQIEHEKKAADAVFAFNQHANTVTARQSVEADKKLADERAANILDEHDRELKLLDIKQARELENFTGTEELKTEILTRHARERSDINAKFLEKDNLLYRVANKAFESILDGTLAKLKEALSFQQAEKKKSAATELAIQRLEAQKSIAALAKQLHENEISYEEYALRRRKIEEDLTASTEESEAARGNIVTSSLELIKDTALDFGAEMMKQELSLTMKRIFLKQAEAEAAAASSIFGSLPWFVALPLIAIAIPLVANLFAGFLSGIKGASKGAYIEGGKGGGADDVLMRVDKGEGILTAEATQRIGGKKAIEDLNAGRDISPQSIKGGIFISATEDPMDRIARNMFGSSPMLMNRFMRMQRTGGTPQFNPILQGESAMNRATLAKLGQVLSDLQEQGIPIHGDSVLEGEHIRFALKSYEKKSNTRYKTNA